MLSTSITLLQRVRRPEDTVAWERFVSLYSPLLLRWAERAGLTEHDAADLVQDVFVVLTQELPGFEYDPARGTFRAWLKTVAVNKGRERLRRKVLARPAGGSTDHLADLPDLPAIDEFWETEYRQHLIRRALEIMQTQFEPKTWQACWEHAVSGQTAEAIGRQLGMSVAAVYVAKSRVLRRLREEFSELLE